MKDLILHDSNFQTLLELNSGGFKQKNPAPHCVNPDCRYFHHKDIHDTSWRRNHGHHDTKAFGKVPRYMCLNCGKTFSNQTFLIDYWVKKPVDYMELLIPLLSTSGQGNITRFQNLRYELIQNRYERLCRMFLALHAELRKQICPDEDFILDGLESFSRSQNYPNNVNIVTGDYSDFIYAMGFSQLRRKGKMTKQQKKKREYLEKKYGKAPPKAVEMSVYSLLCDLGIYLHSNNLSIKKLKTDKNKAYVRAYKRISDISDYLKHEQYSSKAFRNVQNPLFKGNYVDRQVRKDQANHVRETIQFARCPSAMMIRLSLYQVYHNYMMPRRVKEQRKGNWETRGELIGLSKEVFFKELCKVLGKRVFIHKHELWEEEKRTWLMLWRNKGIALGKRVPNYIRI